MKKSIKIITACATCAVALGLGIYAFSLKDANDDIPTFSNIDSTQPTTEMIEINTLPENWAENVDYKQSASGMTGEGKRLFNWNSDIVGWIKINGTKVDYPIVLDPGYISENTPFYGSEGYETNEFYLNHDIDGNILREGSIFMDYRNIFQSVENEQSENIILYGHDMANNNMFGSLRSYWQNYDFYNDRQFIQLTSNYKTYDYVIFSFFVTRGLYDDNDFRYWNMEELDTEEEFDFYINRCKSEALVDTGIDVRNDDTLITLSTCYQNISDLKFIVIGRRLRDGENPNDFSSITLTEEYINAHSTENVEE